MTYDSIPIPQFSLTYIPETEAEKISKEFFQRPYNLGYTVPSAKNEIRSRLLSYDSSEDRIVILSYIINKLTVRILTLPMPKSDMEIVANKNETIPVYTEMLHFLYRLIETEGVRISNDLFSEADYSRAQEIILNIDKVIEQLKSDNPEQSEQLSMVQQEVRKANRFLWLGKEEWVKMVIGALVTTIIKEGITHLLPSILLLCQTFFPNLLDQI